MKVITAAAVAFLLSLASAQAQPAPWMPDRLTPGWVFTPSIVLGTLWDSNVTLRNADEARLKEWSGVLSPRGEIDYNGRRGRFNAGYSGTLEAYRNVAELNRYEQRGRMMAKYAASPRVQLDARSSYTSTPTTDRLMIGTLPFFDIGGRMFETTGGVTIETAPRSHLALQYEYQQVAFDPTQSSSALGILDGGVAHSPSVVFTRTVTRRLSLSAEWQYRYATVNQGLRHFDVQTALGEVSYRVGPNTKVTGGAGASHLAIVENDVSVWGPAIRASLDHSVERTTLTVRYSREFVPSFSFGGLTGNQELAADVRMPLTRGGRLTAAGSVTFSRTDPVRSLGLGHRVDTLWTQASLGYQLSRWLRTEGFLSTMQQTTTIRGDFDRLRVGVQFVTFKPVRIQ